MIQMVMQGVAYDVDPLPGPEGVDTGKMLVFADPVSGIIVQFPLRPEDVNGLVAKLEGREPVKIATLDQIPKMQPQNGSKPR